MNIPLTPLRFKRRAVSLYGNKVGVVCGELRLTYAEFFARCDRLSRALLEMGVKRGDRVAFLAYNCHRLLEAYYGVVQMGGVLLPLNIRLAKDDFTYILNESEARVLFFDSDFREIVSAIRPQLKSVEQFVPLDIPNSDAWSSKRTYDDLLVEAGPQRFDEIEPNEDDVAEMFYTSGTTATPKGVMLTHRNLYLHALTIIIGTSSTDRDVLLQAIPLFHVNGWGTPQSTTCMGGTHVMLRKFDPAQVLQLIEQEKITYMALVPTMANAMLHSPDLGRYDYSSMRMINIGGAAPSVSLISEMERAFGCPCLTGYGLTETAPVLSVATLKENLGALSDEERLRRQAMTGWAQVGVELRVVDENAQDVQPDGQQVGEVIARSDGIMKGYWKHPEETAKVIRDGWFYTGDMGTIDPDGYILIVDRKKDIIISGGENISSLEVEKCICSHPAVFECAVVSVPDSRWGEVPKALVVLNPGAQAGEQEIIEHCKAHLAGYKIPRSVEFLESLPKGGTGKILKRTLREKYWAGESRRIRG